jgi:predicted nucleic acid-binding protein
MGSIYFDTSFLIKLYIPGIGSEKVFSFVKENGEPLLLNQLQETELKNAFALKAFRKEITSSQLSALLTKFKRDVETGRFIRKVVEWEQVWALAQKLSKEYSISMGCRTMDILHVAVAQQLKVDLFLTNDDRQRQLASAMNMNVLF